MEIKDKNKNETTDLKQKKKQKVCCSIGFMLILLPIFFNSYFEYNGDNHALQFLV